MKLKIKTVQHKMESEKQLVSMNAVGGCLVSKPLIPASMLQLVKLSFNLKWTWMKFIGSKQQCHVLGIVTGKT